MANKILLSVLLPFHFFLAFGTFDPFLSSGSAISTIKVLAVGLVLVSIFLYHRSLSNKFERHFIYLFLLLFFLFASSVIYGGAEYNKASFNFELFTCIILYMVLVVVYKENPAYIHYSLISYILGVIFFTLLLYTIYSKNMEMTRGRLIIFGENPNSTSARFTLAVIALLYYVIRGHIKSYFMACISVLAVVPVIYLIIQSGSRGSALALAASVLFIIYFSSIKIKYKVIIGSFIVLAFPYFVVFISDAGSLVERLSNDSISGITAGRDTLWLATLDIIYSSPLIGVGESGYFQEMNKLVGAYKDAHNLFLYILAAGGILSFVCFCFFYKALFHNSLYHFKQRELLPLTLLTNITLIAVKTGGALTYTLMWVIFAIIYSYRENSTA